MLKVYTRTWEEWNLDNWAEFSPEEPLSTINLWRRTLKLNKKWTESDLRQQYMNSTYQANEVAKNNHILFFTLTNNENENGLQLQLKNAKN